MKLNALFGDEKQIYSKKLKEAIGHPKNAGAFTQEDAQQKNLRLVIGKAGKKEEGKVVYLYLLMDENDGVVADAKFQVFGSPFLIGAAEGVCELSLRKNYEQLRRLTADLLDRHFRDKQDVSAFSKDAGGVLNLVLSALEQATEQCLDIPFVESYVAPPMDLQNLGGEGQPLYPHWMELEISQKMAILEEVIASEVRPYIELDAGGIHLIDIANGNEVRIGYEGACTSCYSATGATLSAIQQILKTKIHPAIVVIPDLHQG